MRRKTYIKIYSCLFLGLSLLLAFPIQYWHHAWDEEHEVDHRHQHEIHLLGFCEVEVDHCELCDFALFNYSTLSGHELVLGRHQIHPEPLLHALRQFSSAYLLPLHRGPPFA